MLPGLSPGDGPHAASRTAMTQLIQNDDAAIVNGAGSSAADARIRYADAKLVEATDRSDSVYAPPR